MILMGDQRCLAEFLAVAEGPVGYVDLVNDCFQGDMQRCLRAASALQAFGLAQTIGSGRWVTDQAVDLTPFGRFTLGVVVPAVAP